MLSTNEPFLLVHFLLVCHLSTILGLMSSLPASELLQENTQQAGSGAGVRRGGPGPVLFENLVIITGLL